jgi:hypothetical protein
MIRTAKTTNNRALQNEKIQSLLGSKTSEFPIYDLDMVQKVKFISEKFFLVQPKSFEFDWESRSLGLLNFK